MYIPNILILFTSQRAAVRQVIGKLHEDHKNPLVLHYDK